MRRATAISLRPPRGSARAMSAVLTRQLPGADAQPRAQLHVGIGAHHGGQRRREVAQRAPVHVGQGHGRAHRQAAQRRLLQAEAAPGLLGAELQHAQPQPRLLSFLGRENGSTAVSTVHAQPRAVILHRDAAAGPAAGSSSTATAITRAPARMEFSIRSRMCSAISRNRAPPSPDAAAAPCAARRNPAPQRRGP